LAKGSKSENAKYGAVDITGAVALTKAKKEIRTAVVKDRHTLVGGIHKTKATGTVTITGAEGFTAESLTSEIKAAESLTIEIGDTVLSLAEGEITLTTKESITTTLDAQ